MAQAGQDEELEDVQMGQTGASRDGKQWCQFTKHIQLRRAEPNTNKEMLSKLRQMTGSIVNSFSTMTSSELVMRYAAIKTESMDRNRAMAAREASDAQQAYRDAVNQYITWISSPSARELKVDDPDEYSFATSALQNEVELLKSRTEEFDRQRRRQCPDSRGVGRCS